MGRTYQALLQQNNGTGLTGNALNISATLKTISPLRQEIDTEKLCKIQQSEITVEIADPDDSIWAFIQTCLTVTTPNPGVYRPYLVVYVGGTQVFTGLVQLEGMVRHQASDTHSIELSAQSWDIELEQTYLGSPTALPWQGGTAYPAYAQVYNAGSVYVCVLPGTTSTTTGGPCGIGATLTYGAFTGTGILDGSCVWQYVPPTWQRPVPQIVASNSNSITNVGYSAGAGSGGNQIYFADPVGWAYSGATLQYDYPVFYAYLAAGTITIDVPNPVYGGSVSSYYNAPLERTITTWILPTAVTQLTLPSIQFPAGSVVANMADGIQYKVSTDGKSWVLVPTPYSTALTPGKSWSISSTKDIQNSPVLKDWSIRPAITYLSATMTTTVWPTYNNITCYTPCPGNWSANFTMVNVTSQNLEFWTVQSTVTSGYQIPLNSVNGIMIGDKIQVVNSNSSSTWTVAGVDPTLNIVSTIEQVSNLALGTQIYWASDSIADMVMVDPIAVLQQAVGYASIDVSRLIAPTTNDPLFSFLPLSTNGSAPVYAIGDIEPTLTGLKLGQGACWINPNTGSYQSTLSWTGKPGAWSNPTAATPTLPNADWTCQLLAAPTSLMPYEVTIAPGPAAGIAPFTRLRNRAYGDTQYYRENNGLIYLVTNGTGRLVNGCYVGTTQTGTAGNPVYTYTYTENGNVYTSTNAQFNIWNPTGANVAGKFIVYDYTAMRRIVFNCNPNSNTCAVSVYPWTGASWGTVTNLTWPNSSYIQSAVPFVGRANLVLGYATTASFGGTVNNSWWNSASTSNDRLELCLISGSTISLVGSIAVPSALQNGTLVTTPYGVYLVSGSAIGQVLYSGGVLSINTLYMVDTVTCLFSNTLAALDANSFIIFGRYDTAGDSSTTETRMFRLNTNLQTSLDGSVIWSEKVSAGVPSIMGAVRDPSTPGRVVGHMGGCLWQVSRQRAFGLDRFTPGGLTALQLIEHICQYYSAVAIPDAYGTLHIVSRVNNDVPVNIQVQVEKIDTTYCWDHFYSIIHVAGQDGDSSQYVFGQVGGLTMDFDGHPLALSDSACLAMGQSLVNWFGKPRSQDIQTWRYADINTPAPWETLKPWDLITVNGAAQQYRVMAIEQNYIAGTCNITLISN